MANLPGLVPYCELRVALPGDAYGTMDQGPETVSWDLRGLLASGTGAGRFTGFALDPTGQYLIQAPVPIALDADPTQWSGLGTSTDWGTGTDPETAKKVLRRTVATGTFSPSFTPAFTANEGRTVNFWRGTAASAEFYVWLTPLLRVAFVGGAPVRAQSLVSGTWQDIATAHELGPDAEAYLSGRGRRSSVSVLSECDPAWASGLPGTLAHSGPPPNQVVVTVGGGDAVMVLPAATLGTGPIKITGQNGQFSAGIARLRHVAAPTASLPVQTRPADLTAVAPTQRWQGYAAASTTVALTVSNPTVSQASAALAVDASASVDSTGYATTTVYLSTVDLDYAAVGGAPVTASYTTYRPIYARVVHSFDPLTGFVRTRGELLFSNKYLGLVPGLVHLGARAAQVWMGYYDAVSGVSVSGAGAVQCVLTGYTGLSEDGFGWEVRGGQKYFKVIVDDKMVVGDQEICGEQLPSDYQCHYYAVRQQLYRMGIQDSFCSFPSVARNASTSYYYLPGGTALEPLLKPDPAQHLNDFIALVRKYAGEPTSGQYSPMVIGADATGVIQYYPIPAGLVTAILDPADTAAVSALTPLTTFSRTAYTDGSGYPLLNFLQGGGLSTHANLTRIRNEIVLVGFDPVTGDLLVAWNKNAALGGGSTANPNAPGYVAGRRRFYDISRLYNSAGVIAVGLALASVLLNYPEITVDLSDVPLQPWLYPLMTFAVEDYATTGNVLPVPFFVEEIEKVVDLTRETFSAHSSVRGRLLGIMAS